MYGVHMVWPITAARACWIQPVPHATADLSSGECCVERSHHVGDDLGGGLWGTDNYIVLSWPAWELLRCTGTVYNMRDVNSVFMYILEELNVAFV